MGKLTGKVAIVTGASRGIGEAIAELFAAEGARVVCAARTLNEGDHRMLEGSLARTVQRIRDAGGEAVPVTADVSTEPDCIALVEQARAAFGPIDILVNNAALNYYLPTVDYPTNRWVRCFAVNVHGPFMLAKEVLKDMVPRRSGAIVNISSGAAIGPGRGPYEDQVVRGGVMYGATKAALERFTQGLAQELAQYRGDFGLGGVALEGGADAGDGAPQAGDGDRRSPGGGSVVHGARGAAAGERGGGQGERAGDVQPADPQGVRLDYGGGGARCGYAGVGVFGGLGRFHLLSPTASASGSL